VQLADLRIWGVSDRPHTLARARPAPAAGGLRPPAAGLCKQF